MKQNEMDREIDQIKQMISILARRKYILKSELRRILSGCRANLLTLADIESLMNSIIDDSVTYIDDTVASDSFHSCVILQEEIKKAGCKDLFQLLSVSEEATLLEITEAYNRMQNDDTDNDLYGRIGLLIETDDFLDTYRCLSLAQDVMYELSLRNQFGLLSITEDERCQMINNFIMSFDITPSIATCFIDNCILENDIVVSDKNGIAIDQNKDEGLDEFLIPLPNEGEQNKKDRGLTNGRH